VISGLYCICLSGAEAADSVANSLTECLGAGWRHAHEHQIRICDGREGADGARCVDQHIAAREDERIDQDIDCIGNGYPTPILEMNLTQVL